MKPALILALLAAAHLLTACDGWNAGGARAPRIDGPEAVFLQPCDGPAQHLGAGDWEIIAGRLGDALIDCEARRAGLAEFGMGTVAAVGPQ